MIELKVKHANLERFLLVEEARLTRNGNAAPIKFDGYVSVSHPAIIRLTEDLLAQDHELHAFWLAEKNVYEYDYVSLACSFQPADNQPLSKAWIELELASDDIHEKPIAWSMTPREIINVTKIMQGVKIGANFEFLNAEVQKETENSAKEWFLRTYRERTHQPFWEFRTTEQSKILGSWQLSIVIRRRTGSSGKGIVRVKAVAEKRTFLIFRENIDIESPAIIEFSLSDENQ